MNQDVKKFKELLDNSYIWPCQYSFKFIVPNDSVEEAKKLLGEGEFSLRPSKKGNYVGLTAVRPMVSSDEVIEVYNKLSTIKGVISL